MIVHLVCFKYREDADRTARATHRQGLRDLADIDGILDLKVGEDIVRSERSYDTGLLVLFRDRPALEQYAVHPRHVPVKQLAVGLCASIVSTDFEADR
jgi:hypothetical protein